MPFYDSSFRILHHLFSSVFFSSSLCFIFASSLASRPLSLRVLSRFASSLASRPLSLRSFADEIGTLCCSQGSEEDAKRSGEEVPNGYTRSIIGSFNTGDNNRIALGDPCAFSDDWYDSDSALYKMKQFNGQDGVYFSTNHCDGMYPVICLFENQAAQIANKPTSFRVTFTQPCHNALCDALGMP